MSMREDKQRQVSEIRERFEKAKSVILTDYRGINVADMTELRKQLREAGIEYKVLKNTLVKIALEGKEVDEIKDSLQGPTALAFGYDDPVTAAKILSDFSKNHENNLPVVKAGILEGKVIDTAGVTALADLPSREVLLSMVLSGMQAPITGFVRASNGIISSLVYALNAVREQKEQAS
ncbi:50S ribosomal protein L10 [Clostridium sp. 'deep sea']|uniref:50S ribosomal protein L10 n=1 Tax=Clostridium sp. 'deep sea' TaxID=2779445 RepID=UPI0018963F15|nr:50S ribosomal protein L10 [Clostridium sp. 'deep sea']QOR34568.1 50S ribosomal protein L10 [Clostridium sp. 'deep sea']